MDPEEFIVTLFNITGRHSQERRDMLATFRNLLDEHGDLFIASDIAQLKELALEHTELVVPGSEDK